MIAELSGDVAATAADLASPSPRSRKGARTRSRLVQAAKEVFERDGLLEARIAAIAERAGVSYGCFYHYFESKEALFRELADEVDARLHAPVDDIIFARQSEMTPHDRIREAIRLHFETYRADAPLLRVIEQVARLDEQVGAARDHRYRERTAQVADSIRQLQRHGLADAGLDPTVAAAALGAMTYRFAEYWLAHGGIDCDFDIGVETVTRLFVNALGIDAA